MNADALRTWTSGIAGTVGLWLLASPFVLEAPRLLQWSNVGTGALVTVLGWFTAYVLYAGRQFNRVAAGFAALGGAWAVLSPVVLGAGGALLWSNVAAGVAVVALTGYGLYVDSDLEVGAGDSTAA